MKFLDQNNECMQECYECQDEHQEHFEDHDEHQEHNFEKFLMQRKHARHQTQKSLMHEKYECKNAHENKKRHKTRKHQDQTRRLIKNNLKIMKNTMNAWDFRKNARKILKACN